MEAAAPQYGLYSNKCMYVCMYVFGCHKLDHQVVLGKGGETITKIDIKDMDLDDWYEVATSSRTE